MNGESDGVNILLYIYSCIFIDIYYIFFSILNILHSYLLYLFIPAERKMFEQKRKMHYNEFQAIKLARQLMEEADEEEEISIPKSEGEQEKRRS